MANAFVSILDHAGSVIKEIFVKGLPIAEKLDAAADPYLEEAFPGMAGLLKSTLAMLGNAEATGLAAASGTATGPVKLAAVVSSLEPIAIDYLKQRGITADSTTITNWTNAFVALLNTIPAPSKPAAPAV
jgi:hypothetical protein